MKRWFGWLACVGVLLMVSGCVSTPASRIRKNPELFSSFPPEVQAKVQQGRVEVGFTRDMVRLALGLPHRIYTRVTEAGQVEIWVYTSYRYVSQYVPMDSGYYYRDRAGRIRRSYDTMWVDNGYSIEYPALRLEFVGDKIKAIERQQR